MSAVRHSRTRRAQRAFAIAIALLVATPDAALAVETAGADTPAKSMDRMSPQELEHFVQQLNESANWRKYRRPSDPPDFKPGKPVKLMHGAGSSLGRGGGGRGGGVRGGGQSFRRGGLANRRNAKSGRGQNRDDAMAQSRGSSRSSRSGSNSSSGSRSGFGSSSRNGSGFGSSSRSSLGSGSRNGSGFSNGNSSFGQ